MAPNNTKLSSSVTVQRYLDLIAAEDRKAIARFIRDRFDERYFAPMARQDRSKKHGFAMMAVACLVVETLESFYQGLPDTRNKGAKMFKAFFERDTPLRVFASNDNWFYKDVRNGILHQGEARRGWRILRRGPLLDTGERAINATRFLSELRKVVAAYATLVETEGEYWRLFKKKMSAVCKNCEPPAERGS